MLSNNVDASADAYSQPASAGIDVGDSSSGDFSSTSNVPQLHAELKTAISVSEKSLPVEAPGSSGPDLATHSTLKGSSPEEGSSPRLSIEPTFEQSTQAVVRGSCSPEPGPAASRSVESSLDHSATGLRSTGRQSEEVKSSETGWDEKSNREPGSQVALPQQSPGDESSRGKAQSSEEPDRGLSSTNVHKSPELEEQPNVPSTPRTSPAADDDNPETQPPAGSANVPGKQDSDDSQRSTARHGGEEAGASSTAVKNQYATLLIL